MNRKTFTKSDTKFIVILLIIAIFMILLNINKKTHKSHAEIIYKGNLIKSLNLSNNTTFSITEKPNVVFEVKDGAIRFVSSDCPDKLCVKTGFVKDPWQVCACLPNDIIIKIVSDNKY